MLTTLQLLQHLTHLKGAINCVACRAQSQAHGHLSTGNIVGIVLGAVGGAIILGVAATFMVIAWTRNRRLPRLKEGQPSFRKFEDASVQV